MSLRNFYPLVRTVRRIRYEMA